MGQGDPGGQHQGGVSRFLARGQAMKLSRRQSLHLAAGAAALPVLSRAARAQSYPTRPVHIVAPFAAGGHSDVLGRLLGQWLSERLGQRFIIENRPGAGSNIGTESVVRAPPDGYTLLVVTPANVINATLYEKLNFNFIRDIAPVAGIDRQTLMMIVNPSVPVMTVAEFIAYVKTNPGKINMASGGIGTTSHMAGELFKVMTGLDMTHVPYSGGAAPATTNLLGGHVQVMFSGGLSSIPYIKTGSLRALAVANATRWDALPDIPTVGESVPGYEVSPWDGLGAPKNTPAEIIEKLNKEINAALADRAGPGNLNRAISGVSA
jgi:tripartite-type tricarboxylate transporter receptor subunit TctC